MFWWEHSKRTLSQNLPVFCGNFFVCERDFSKISSAGEASCDLVEEVSRGTIGPAHKLLGAYPKTLGVRWQLYIRPPERGPNNRLLSPSPPTAAAPISFDSKLSSFCLPRSIRPAGSVVSVSYCAVLFERVLPILLRIFGYLFWSFFWRFGLGLDGSRWWQQDRDIRTLFLGMID